MGKCKPRIGPAKNGISRSQDALLRAWGTYDSGKAVPSRTRQKRNSFGSAPQRRRYGAEFSWLLSEEGCDRGAAFGL